MSSVMSKFGIERRHGKDDNYGEQKVAEGFHRVVSLLQRSNVALERPGRCV